MIELFMAIYYAINWGEMGFGIIASLYVILPLAAVAFTLNLLINKLIENRKLWIFAQVLFAALLIALHCYLVYSSMA